MSAPRTLEAVKDASHLYEVERRAYHLQRPGFRVAELQLSPTQKVPWHYHNNISDTFYVVEGTMRLFLQELTFLIMQGVGEYDYVPLV
jgi:quercetin dioxygenase-like cupin family protein